MVLDISVDIETHQVSYGAKFRVYFEGLSEIIGNLHTMNSIYYLN